MYVCICSKVTDKQICRAVGEGACTLEEIRHKLAVGSRCGMCLPAAREALQSALQKSESAELQSAILA